MKNRFVKSIRGKILIAILGLTLITLLSVTGIFYLQSARTIEEQYVSVLQQQAENLMDEMDEEIIQVYHATVYASCDENLKEKTGFYLQENEESDLQEMAQLLCEYKKQSHAITSMYLLIPKAHVVLTSEEYPVYRKEISDEKIQTLIQTGEQESGPMLIDDPVHEGNTLFSCVEEMTSSTGEILGYVMSNMAERELYYSYITGWDDDAVTETVILDRHRRIVAGSSEEGIGSLYQREYFDGFTGSKMTDRDRENIYLYCSSSFAQIGLFVVANQSVILQNLQWVRWFFMAIVSIFAVLAVILSFFLSHVIYRPLKRLTIAMEEVSGGNLETRADVMTHDEIGELAAEFNSMLDRIEDLIRRLIEEEQKKKDMELEALQYQITPHFMYNTLNSIKYAALLKGEKEIAQVISDFVELLQAAISKKGTFLTVSEEFHILENYIRLQEFRYGGGFDVAYEMDEETQNCLIPRLILQPLVENALLHGMDMKEKRGELKISASVKDGQLLLKVMDNGRGISREQIEALLTSKVKKERGFTAVGIPNVRDRLKLYYGEQGGILYESSDGGTTAVIYLPVRKGE